ncbi:caspase family protein [Streptomyces sp. NPDC046862]|uniref:caspase family protein n=1 Tax=Streptomyces sp. NPDC046862 TaxID=3154603 RepID=UPI003453CD5B
MAESRHALIIANDSYENPGLKKLRAPAHDAVALARVLSNPRIGDFDVEVVRNKPAHVIAMHIEEFFSDRRPGDTLVLHFSCHGLKNESGELYFAAKNTLPRRLDTTAVSAHLVRRCMYSTRARGVVLFLDCCYGGAFSRGASARASGDVNVLESFEAGKLGGGRGRAVITASDAMEFAFEDSELAEGSDARPSLFTHAVVEGLETGEADRDEDGRVSINELYDYVFDHVQERTPHQTPSKSVDLQGDMYLAHSNRRTVRPADVPDEVRDAMRSPDPYRRRGAIAELRSRMENPDLSIALGAREALTDLARHDIRFVAEEASRAVSEVRVDPHPTRVEFGPVTQHSPPPHRTVRLLGPPLARSCQPHADADWLRTEKSGDGLDVHVDTSVAGRRRGDIVLKGIVGEAVLHVEVEVQPQERAETERERVEQKRAERVETERAEREKPGKEKAEGVAGRTLPKTPRALWAAAAAAALAVVSAVMVVLAAADTVDVVDTRVGWGCCVADAVNGTGLVSRLVTSLVTAVAALISGAFARHDLASRSDSYTARHRLAARHLTSAAKLLAVPALILATLVGVAFLVWTGIED